MPAASTAFFCPCSKGETQPVDGLTARPKQRNQSNVAYRTERLAGMPELILMNRHMKAISALKVGRPERRATSPRGMARYGYFDEA